MNEEDLIYRSYFNDELMYVNRDFSLIDVNIGADVGGGWFRVGQQSTLILDYNPNSEYFRLSGSKGSDSSFYKIKIGTIKNWVQGKSYRTTYTLKGGSMSVDRTAWFNTGANYGPYWLTDTYLISGSGKTAVNNAQNNSNIFIVIGDAANGTTYNNLMFSLSVREA